jgi:nitroreductase
MDLAEAIRSRRSIRKYQDREVPLEMILKAVELATWAPNNGGFQAWRFFVVRDRAVIDRIADVVQAKVDQMATWPEADEFRETIDRHRQRCAFFRPAAALVIIGMGGYQGPMDKVLAKRDPSDDAAQSMIRNRRDISSRGQTMGATSMLLELALHEQGLSSCWLAGPMVARQEISEILGVPEGVQLFDVVAVGYAAEEKVAAPRKPLSEVVTVI